MARYTIQEQVEITQLEGRIELLEKELYSLEIADEFDPQARYYKVHELLVARRQLLVLVSCP